MQEMVIELGCTWQYNQEPRDIEVKCSTDSVQFDDLTFIAITDKVKKQVCVLHKGDKYGIYTLDHTNGMGGSGIWCNPTLDPFPYDEVKYCAYPDIHDVGFFAFRIGEKWGIIKVVDGDNEEEGIFDVEYLLSKRRIVVPCQYVALEDAELQLGASFKWKNPIFTKEEDFQTTAPIKRNVKRGTGRDKIRVTFPDGMIIEDSVVWKTLAETIKRLGVQRVEKLKIPGIEKRNILLLDTHPTADSIYRHSQKEIAPGYYLLTYNNTPQKAIYLEQISDELHANLKIELISY